MTDAEAAAHINAICDEIDARYREFIRRPDGNCLRCRVLVSFGMRGEVIRPATTISADGEPYCEAHIARGNMEAAVRRRQREERAWTSPTPGRPS